MKQTAHIENWRLRRANDGSFYLLGEVTDHPHQDDFEVPVQQTSQVLEFNPKESFAQTQNTRYTLGAQHPDDVVKKAK